MSHEDPVLIVEDVREMRDMIARMLKLAGYDSEPARSSDEALERLDCDTSRRVSAVIIDLNLDGESGADLVAKIRGAHPDLPVVFCSGYPNLGADYPDIPFVYKRADDDNGFRRDLVATVKRVIRDRCRDIQIAETRKLGGETHVLAKEILGVLSHEETGLKATQAIAKAALARDLGDLAADQVKKPIVKWLLGAVLTLASAVVVAQVRDVTVIRDKVDKLARKVNVE